jgi:hypothetical protein
VLRPAGFALAVIVATIRPERGVQDRLAGTWLVLSQLGIICPWSTSRSLFASSEDHVYVEAAVAL